MINGDRIFNSFNFRKRKYVGNVIFYRDTVTSVMDIIIDNKFIEGTVIIADKQLKGRGKDSRKWYSPLGGLYLAYKLVKKVPAIKIQFFYYLNALAVVKTLEAFNLRPRVKWFNDVLVNNKKICGILIESFFRSNYASPIIVGIGINVNISKEDFPKELRDKATSMLIELKKHIDRRKLFNNLIDNIDEYVCRAYKGQWKEIAEEWFNYSIVSNKKVEITLPSGEKLEGVIVGLDYNSGFPILDINGERYETALAGGIEDIRFID